MLLLLQASFVYTRRSRCLPFLLFPTNVLSNKIKQACYKMIFINSLFIIYNDINSLFIKYIQYCRKLKNKCGHHNLVFRRITKVGRKVGVKAATFLSGLFLIYFYMQIGGRIWRHGLVDI